MDEDREYFRITKKGEIDVADVAQAVRTAWDDMRKPGTRAHAAAVKANLDLTNLPASFDEAVEVRQHGVGVGSVDLVVAGLLAKMAYDAWKDVWKYILFPKIKEKWGDGAITPLPAPAEDKPAKDKKKLKVDE